MQSTRRIALHEECDFLRRRWPAEDFVAVRKAPELLDDLEVGYAITAQAAGAIGISRQGIEERYRAPLIGEIFAVMERHVEEDPPDGWKQPVEAAFKRPVCRSAGGRVGGISAWRAAEDVARQLIE